MKQFHEELCKWLDQQTITGDNIGTIRRQCFVPWGSEWNSIVREETALRERPSVSGKLQEMLESGRAPTVRIGKAGMF